MLISTRADSLVSKASSNGFVPLGCFVVHFHSTLNHSSIRIFSVVVDLLKSKKREKKGDRVPSISLFPSHSAVRVKGNGRGERKEKDNDKKKRLEEVNGEEGKMSQVGQEERRRGAKESTFPLLREEKHRCMHNNTF
jgi:hypothetical protein